MAIDCLLVLLPILLLLPLVPVLSALVKGKKGEKKVKPKLPPRPPGLPVIGNLHQLGKNPHRTLWELSKRYGPLMHLQLGRVTTVVVSTAHMAEAVLKTHDLSFCSRPVLISWRRLTYDSKDAGFLPYGSTWREQRKILVLGLLSTRKVEGFRSVREGEVERMISSISSQASLSGTINLSKLLHSLSNDITCRVAFGKRFRSGGRGTQENSFHEILKETNALLVESFLADYIPWAGWVDVLTGRRSRLERNFAALDAFYREMIKAHADPTRPPGVEQDFLDVLLGLQKENPLLTQDHIKGLLLDSLVGGTETSSSTLEFAMAELVRNPGAMLKAQEEVRGVVGEKGKVEESDIPQLSYLKCVVKETLRLHAAAPLLGHRETMNHVNVDGYDIPAKTMVIVNAWAIGRETDSWEKPEEFIPERFVDSTIDFTGQDFRFIPFGAGRRICPGMTSGVMVVELALANLLYAFNWEAPHGMGKEGVDMNEGTGLTIHLKNGLHLKATKHNYGNEINKTS